MKWHVVVRVGKEDSFEPEYGDDLRLLVDFNRPRSPWLMREHVLDVLLEAIGSVPSSPAVDFLHFGMAVYAADRCILREYADDRWERNINLYVPVAEPARWEPAQPLLEEALGFLSGDRWRISFRESSYPYRLGQAAPGSRQTVCLFSGGADSLVGAIDLLEAGRDVIFVGHYAGGTSHCPQSRLQRVLQDNYACEGSFLYFNVMPPNIPGIEFEMTMRTRSLLFLSLGVATVMTAACEGALYVPENGLISLNVPLTPSRMGSLSTRTTHPHFMGIMRRVLQTVQIPVSLEQPYRFKTKGEMLAECRNQDVLSQCGPLSMSCSHPDQRRLRGLTPGQHCGYCLPCLVRRAAFHKAGIPDAPYDYAPSDGGDYSAVMIAIERFKRGSNRQDFFDVQKTGPISGDEITEYVSVYRRGMDELATFLTGAGRSE